MALTRDSFALNHLIGCQVSVVSRDGEHHEGCCAAIDPVTASIIIVSNHKLSLIPWINLDLIKTLDGDSCSMDFQLLQSLIPSEESQEKLQGPAEFSEELNSGLSNLVAWLRQNSLVVDIIGHQVVIQDGLVTISPPYKPTDCQATNEIILQRVSDLVNSWQQKNSS